MPAPVLLLTRPRAASEAFAGLVGAQLGRDIRVLVSPVIEIVDHGPLPDLSATGTLILTSTHAAERLGRSGALVGRDVRTVGDATAHAAGMHGAKAIALGHDAQSFLQNARDLAPPCTHCRGVHTRGDIAATLNARGIRCDEAVIYDQRARDLSDEARAAFSDGERMVAPIFSPRSAQLLSAQVPSNANLSVIAISPAAAEAWSGPGCLTIAPTPTSIAMVEAVADAF